MEWIVIGGGPSGIAAVGQLLSANVNPKKIAWIDPEFKVGDFGTSWKQVVSNTSVEWFLKFYNAFDAFGFKQKQHRFMIEHMKPESTCPLMLAAQPLNWITENLRNQVTSIVGIALRLSHTGKSWLVHCTDGQCFVTQKVILALGGEALTLPYSDLRMIPLKVAADINLLSQSVDSKDTVAVFGSYQSARTVQEHLGKTNVARIIHFYRSEYSFENYVASLKLSNRVEAYPITNSNLLTYIPQCNKAIYAIGFERRPIFITGLPNDFTYDSKTGQIAPGVYGLGMAFPEIMPYMMGRIAYKVTAIWPVIKHLKKISPLWLQEPKYSVTLSASPMVLHSMRHE